MTTIADEPVFKRMLSLECRRCERADARFALLLIDMEAVSCSVSTLEKIGLEIGAAMRETDITGWYQYPSTIGVILTTLNGAGRDELESLMVERVKVVLALHLKAAQMEGVRISCHLFPEDSTATRIFYSDHEGHDFKGNYPATTKRAIDVAGSLTALLVLLPLFISIAVLIRVTSSGPVFFRQKRLGKFGEEFTFLKFRSMYADNDPGIHREYVRNLIENKVSDCAKTYKIKDDPRVTLIGRFLRKSSLDELPQFINVLKGQMSLVGPRPPIPYEFENYSLWHRRRILSVKPGITGEWQVHGRSKTTFDEMVRMDLRYIRNQSIWLDLKILMKTPLVVLSGDGAY